MNARGVRDRGIGVEPATETETSRPAGSAGGDADATAQVRGPKAAERNAGKRGRVARDLRRAYALGVDALESEELVRLLQGGARTATSAQLEALGLDGLSRATPAELERRFALAPRDAVRVASAFELGRRVARTERVAAPGCHSAPAVFRLVAPIFAGLERERFVVLLLDGKHRLRRIETVSEGTLTTSLVHPREVFAPAVRESAAAIVVAHNHPSGDPEPSAEDLAVTRRLRRVGRLLGIPLVDHLVVGSGRYVSLRERQW